jgi:hypothetical protein
MEQGKIKKFFNEFWRLLWKDDSLKGWVLSIIVLFIFIKFIFFPLLNLVTGTSLPLAIVESCSMYHQGNILSNYNDWFLSHNSKYSAVNITKSEFDSFPFKKGFNKGDILFIVGTKPANLKVGDIIIFSAPTTNPVIHRIINIQKQGDSYTFSTMGDNNNGQLSFEKQINQNQIVGKAVAKVMPYLGWVKLIFFEGSKPANERGFCSEN